LRNLELAEGGVTVTEARHVFDQAEEHVRVQRALVRLVHHDDGIRGHVGLAQELAQHHAVCHVDQLGLVRGRVCTKASGYCFQGISSMQQERAPAVCTISSMQQERAPAVCTKCI